MGIDLASKDKESLVSEYFSRLHEGNLAFKLMCDNDDRVAKSGKEKLIETNKNIVSIRKKLIGLSEDPELVKMFICNIIVAEIEGYKPMRLNSHDSIESISNQVTRLKQTFGKNVNIVQDGK